MQISAANLLLAAQQPRAATAPAQPGGGFAQALGKTTATKPAQFAPASFEAENKTAGTKPAAAAQTKAASGYQSGAAPGARLDIRV